MGAALVSAPDGVHDTMANLSGKVMTFTHSTADAAALEAAKASANAQVVMTQMTADVDRFMQSQDAPVRDALTTAAAVTGTFRPSNTRSRAAASTRHGFAAAPKSEHDELRSLLLAERDELRSLLLAA